ncbi:hypothetical protein MJO28_003474 [Puccinia striiformis f. sp. tritici]|uniref:Uncharacterized protein n=1 Tax=Puccinia striiformis f. sp. tritici TaxID=168172 RepID=A0ACC0ETY2_9BASI|nr:hypothetical protein Pst134EA_004619 [Puccinia striiformis f. sp. tritici]KAI9613355.1 hypothetical protein H4Q26_009955 [Puccinia striiformis f. sp. tritici PST-130]KAH9461766.1 hypothetical protein Pst134EB_005687 [Puccinia striiformis f. sp. tritici]KAH9470696.1 hypothetical protein Pst134EA_004619 [Puccinia striiformis f. sp. tritici]KAI7959683.1 hypothetical protein MJO28_003474 [Puccinia striiformis f. sp. tritici]KAI7965428.1 hypothetical protein MJO29_003526 [Puccinia striiformis f.
MRGTPARETLEGYELGSTDEEDTMLATSNSGTFLLDISMPNEKNVDSHRDIGVGRQLSHPDGTSLQLDLVHNCRALPAEQLSRASVAKEIEIAFMLCDSAVELSKGSCS